MVLLCLVTARFARWAMGELAGLYAGVILATCVGIFLFTRVLIPDVVLTLTITMAMWSFLRVLDDEEKRPVLWAMSMWGAMAAGHTSERSDRAGVSRPARRWFIWY